MVNHHCLTGGRENHKYIITSEEIGENSSGFRHSYQDIKNFWMFSLLKLN